VNEGGGVIDGKFPDALTKLRGEGAKFEESPLGDQGWSERIGRSARGHPWRDELILLSIGCE